MPSKEHISPASPQKANTGNWVEWGKVWTGLGQESAGMLYTPGKPRTLLQFWQRCYFEDLWGLMEKRNQPARCLELGSGRGTTSMYLASRGCEVTMVDLAESAFTQAQSNFERMGIKLPKFVLADAANTGLPAESYNCVYNIGLLEHFEDPRPVLRESWRLLAPGGLLYSVIVPTVPDSRQWLAESLFAPWRFLLRPARRVAKKLLGRPLRSPAAPGMVRTENPRQQYVDWMREIGAIDVQCLPYNPYVGLWQARLSIGPFLALYRLHYRCKGSRPSLATWSSVATCDLLLARKVRTCPL